MATLVLSHSNEEIEIEDGGTIKDQCEDAGVPFACTEGVCGTCVIEVDEGMENLSEPTEEEIDFLGEDGCEHERLACQCKIKSGRVVATF